MNMIKPATSPRAFARVAAILFLTAAFDVAAAWRENDEHIKSRNEVTVHALVARVVNTEPVKPEVKTDAQSTSTEAAPADIVFFFPGAEGRVRSARGGVSNHNPAGRPSTMGLLAESLGMVVAIGLPTDQSSGISTQWRLGPEHSGDAGAVIDSFSKRYPQARITLVGMSNGGRSVTAVANAIVRRGAPKLHSVVVMASMPEAINADVMQAILAARLPVMVMHHKRDSCLPYRFMESAVKQFEKSVVWLGTDDSRAPTVSPFNRDCAPGSAHVFGGREEWAYGAIAEWVKTGGIAEALRNGGVTLPDSPPSKR
jgi:dienelactone hydrolase